MEKKKEMYKIYKIYFNILYKFFIYIYTCILYKYIKNEKYHQERQICIKIKDHLNKPVGRLKDKVM